MDLTQKPSEEQSMNTRDAEKNQSVVARDAPEKSREPREKIFGEERLLVLSDGIFAIATTLLVLDIRLPSGLSEAGFNAALLSLFSNSILFYLITFAVIASFWTQHRHVMHYVKYMDSHFIWLNLLFLAFIAFFPASSSILAQYSYSGAVILYTLTFAGCGLSLVWMWLYAAWGHRLVEPELAKGEVRSLIIRIALTPIYFSLSLLLLFFFSDNPTRIFWSWLLLPIFTFPFRLIRRKYFPSTSHDQI